MDFFSLFSCREEEQIWPLMLRRGVSATFCPCVAQWVDGGRTQRTTSTSWPIVTRSPPPLFTAPSPAWSAFKELHLLPEGCSNIYPPLPRQRSPGGPQPARRRFNGFVLLIPNSVCFHGHLDEVPGKLQRAFPFALS